MDLISRWGNFLRFAREVHLSSRTNWLNFINRRWIDFGQMIIISIISHRDSAADGEIESETRLVVWKHRTARWEFEFCFVATHSAGLWWTGVFHTDVPAAIPVRLAPIPPVHGSAARGQMFLCAPREGHSPPWRRRRRCAVLIGGRCSQGYPFHMAATRPRGLFTARRL